MALTGWRRTALVLALYAQQGLSAGFWLVALPNHEAARGATPAEVGAHLALVGLPWILQPLWGPVVDRFGGLPGGARRPWAVLGQGGMLLALGLAALAAPATLGGFAPFLLLHGAAAALADTAADAWLIDRLPPAERGRATAETRMGFVTGLSVSGAALGALLPAMGVAPALLVLAGGTAALALVPLLAREGPPLPAAAPARLPALLAALGRELARPATLALLLFCVAQEAAGALLRVPLAVALVQEGGWTAPELSRFQSALALAAGTLGAWAAGWAADRWGGGRVLAALLGAAALAHALAALGVLAGGAALAAIGVTGVMGFVALAPAVMRDAAGPLAATRFALFMAALNAGDSAGAALGPALAGAAGLAGCGAVAALLLGCLAAAARARARD